ncbi:MAG TPA: alanine--glyoxylate aminotransferase family protein, partial [Limnochordia bacterium]
LRHSLRLLAAEGLENGFRRHALMRDMVREGARALGLPLFADDRWASPTVTAIRTPPGVDVEAFRRRLKARYGVELAGGQGELKGQIFRVGHMGYAGPLDMIAALSAIEMGLLDCGYPAEIGAGIAAAQKVWAATWR